MASGYMDHQMYDYSNGPVSGLGFGSGMGAAGQRMYMMNNGGLNTIEEEKHETQTSNYFKEGDETDESKVEHQKSKFLQALEQDRKNESEIKEEDNAAKQN